jgi:arsenate reductase (glutaredoxin)
MKKVYYLKTCSTCQRILKEWELGDDVELQNIKTEQMTAEQMDEMIALAGSAEALFSRKAMKYRAMGLNEKTLSEKDYRQLIIDEYTFLKRPILILDNQIFIGNSKAVVAEAKAAL